MTTPAIDPKRLAKLASISLLSGSHGSAKKGLCALEAVAWLAKEKHSDAPQCACPVVAAFVRRLNDRIPDDAMRTRLLGPLLPLIVGSRSTPEVERRRMFIAVDFAVRDAAASALDLRAATKVHAATLRALPEIVDQPTARNAAEVTKVVRSAADAAAYAAAYAAAAAAAYAAAAADAAYVVRKHFPKPPKA